jgi:hypothetical protein
MSPPSEKGDVDIIWYRAMKGSFDERKWMTLIGPEGLARVTNLWPLGIKAKCHENEDREDNEMSTQFSPLKPRSVWNPLCYQGPKHCS